MRLHSELLSVGIYYLLELLCSVVVKHMDSHASALGSTPA